MLKIIAAVFTATLIAQVSGTSGIRDRRAIFLGTWAGVSHANATPFSHAGTSHARNTCRASDGNQFVVCSQRLTESDGSVAENLAIYTYNVKTAAYGYVQIQADGRAFGESLAYANGAWTYSGSYTGKSGKVLYRTIDRFPSPDVETFVSEYSTDNGTRWHTIATGRATKVREPSTASSTMVPFELDVR